MRRRRTQGNGVRETGPLGTGNPGNYHLDLYDCILSEGNFDGFLYLGQAKFSGAATPAAVGAAVVYGYGVCLPHMDYYVTF